MVLRIIVVKTTEHTLFDVLLTPNINSSWAKISASDKFLWIKVRADLENL